MNHWKQDPPTDPGLYNHRWKDASGRWREQTLFVGWVDCLQPKCQGRVKPRLAGSMRCCKLNENLHADRLTPQEWGGQWSEA